MKIVTTYWSDSMLGVKCGSRLEQGFCFSSFWFQVLPRNSVPAPGRNPKLRPSCNFEPMHLDRVLARLEHRARLRLREVIEVHGAGAELVLPRRQVLQRRGPRDHAVA